MRSTHCLTDVQSTAFLSSLLKDIKAERPKITEKDNLRLLFITKWFLEFFLCLRTSDKSRTWKFGLVAEVTERSWIVWVLRRMREAVDSKVRSSLPTAAPCSLLSAQTVDRAPSRGGVSNATGSARRGYAHVGRA